MGYACPCGPLPCPGACIMPGATSYLVHAMYTWRASLPVWLQELARAGLRNPVRVNVAVAVAHQQQADKGAKGSSKGGKDGSKGKGQQGEDDADADAAGEAAAAAGAGADAEGVQKTPNSLSISYVVCEADEKIPQLVGLVRVFGLRTSVLPAVLYCNAPRGAPNGVDRPSTRATELGGA